MKRKSSLQNKIVLQTAENKSIYISCLRKAKIKIGGKYD